MVWDLISIFLLLCISFMIIGIMTIKFHQNKSEYLSGFFDKIGTGALGGIFVSWMINIDRISLDSSFGKIHIVALCGAALLIIWSIVSNPRLKNKK